MKLETSQLLTRLNDQERVKVETELAELNARKQRIERGIGHALEEIRNLGQQRDQASNGSNSASLLQNFDTSVREQQALLVTLHEQEAQVESEKQGILQRLAEVNRTHHVYDKMHQQEKKRLNRRDEAKAQRQMDDMIASRSSSSASS